MLDRLVSTHPGKIMFLDLNLDEGIDALPFKPLDPGSGHVLELECGVVDEVHRRVESKRVRPDQHQVVDDLLL